MPRPQFTNPRLEAEFTDWPLGGSRRGVCRFTVETNKRGSRILRTTTGKPKASTYSDAVAIVDGDDGRTYLLHYGRTYDAVSIYQSDNQHNAHWADVPGGGHYVHKGNEPEAFAALFALIEQANGR